MKKILALTALCIFLIYGNCWAANVVANANGQLKITLDGSNDFEWATATITSGPGYGQKVSAVYPNGLALTSIDFQGSAAGAKGIWRDRATTGNIMGPPFNTIDGGPQTKYLTGNWMRKPSILNSEQTTPTSTVWYFYFDRSN